MNKIFQNGLQWLLKEFASPTVEKELITFGINELTSNTKLTAAEIKTILTDVQTVVTDALAALPPVTTA